VGGGGGGGGGITNAMYTYLNNFFYTWRGSVVPYLVVEDLDCLGENEPAMTALVVAMAWMMFPAIDFTSNLQFRQQNITKQQIIE